MPENRKNIFKLNKNFFEKEKRLSFEGNFVTSRFILFQIKGTGIEKMILCQVLTFAPF